MDIIIGSRQSGKTTEMIKRSAESWIPIVVSCAARVAQIKNQAFKMGLKIPDPLSLESYMNKRKNYDKHISCQNGILIDQFDHILNVIFNNKIHAFTIDKESVEDFNENINNIIWLKNNPLLDEFKQGEQMNDK